MRLCLFGQNHIFVQDDDDDVDTHVDADGIRTKSNKPPPSSSVGGIIKYHAIKLALYSWCQNLRWGMQLYLKGESVTIQGQIIHK